MSVGWHPDVRPVEYSVTVPDVVIFPTFVVDVENSVNQRLVPSEQIDRGRADAVIPLVYVVTDPPDVTFRIALPESQATHRLPSGP